MELKHYDASEMLALMNKLIEVDLWKYVSKEIKLTIPFFSEFLLIKMLENVENIFSKEPMILHLSSPVCVIGDLHGNLLDLLTILKNFGLPPQNKYIFLGDLIDRGEFSIETVVYIYLLKIRYPNEIFIIRGNHEQSSVCARFGFKGEVRRKYNTNHVYQSFVSAFDQTPLAALIDSHILCIHGGIGPNSQTLKDIASVERPLHSLQENSPAYDILWSDPCDTAEEFLNSPRGFGWLFGPKHLAKFMRRNKISLIVRGHEVAMGGVYYGFEGKIVTVFSASNYCDMKNFGGILKIDANCQITAYNHQPYEHGILKTEAEYINVGPNNDTNSDTPSIPRPKIKPLHRKAASMVSDKPSRSTNVSVDFPESAAELAAQRPTRRKKIIPHPSKSVCSDSVAPIQQTPSQMDLIDHPIDYKQKPVKTKKRSKSVIKQKKKLKSPRRKSPPPMVSVDIASEIISAQIKDSPKPKRKKSKKLKKPKSPTKKVEESPFV